MSRLQTGSISVEQRASGDFSVTVEKKRYCHGPRRGLGGDPAALMFHKRLSRKWLCELLVSGLEQSGRVSFHPEWCCIGCGCYKYCFEVERLLVSLCCSSRRIRADRHQTVYTMPDVPRFTVATVCSARTRAPGPRKSSASGE